MRPLLVLCVAATACKSTSPKVGVVAGVVTVTAVIPDTIADTQTANVTWTTTVGGDYVVGIHDTVVNRGSAQANMPVTTNLPASALVIGQNRGRIVVFPSAGSVAAAADFDITLTAAANGAVLSFTPSSYAFPTANTGTRAPVSLTLVNSGGSPAVFPAVSASSLGVTAPLSLTGGTCVGATALAPSASCTLLITYAPTNAGATSEILAVGNATVTVTGTALSPCAAIASDASDYTLIGTGTVASPYLLCTANQLMTMSFAPTSWGNAYALGVDLDLQSIVMDPIGIAATPFTGSFDGQGHTLANFNMTSGIASESTGLFGTVASTAALIERVHLTSATVSGQAASGILIGTLDRGAVLDCSSSGTVTGGGMVGGLIGHAIDGAVIASSSSSAQVSDASDDAVGGLVGELDLQVWIENSVATGAVSGRSQVGGLVGYANLATIINSYATGSVTAATGLAAGLVGQGGILNAIQSFTLSTVTANAATAGPVGHFANVTYSTFYHCFHDSGATCAVGGDDGACSGLDSSNMGDEQGDPTLTDFNTPATLFSTSLVGQPSWDMTNVWQAQSDAPPVLAPQLFDYGAWGDCSTHGTGTLAGGRGTPEAPYLICTPAQLIGIANVAGYGYGAVFRLMADIDLGGIGGNAFPIGHFSSAVYFFDGNGKHIANLAITNTQGAWVGLFSDIYGVIKRVTMVGAHITSNADNAVAGSVVGSMRGIVIDVAVDATSAVTATGSNSDAGGIAGTVWSGVILDSYAAATVSGAGVATGIAHERAVNTFTTGSVTGSTNSGQLVAYGVNAGTCMSTFYDETNSYYLSAMTCDGCCTAGYGTAEANGFFEGSSAGPLFSTWDFAHVWQANDNALPTLR